MEQPGFIPNNKLSDLIYNDLLKLLYEKNIHFEAVLIYGSYAFHRNTPNSDLDVIVYSSKQRSSDHIKHTLNNGIKISVNIIGETALADSNFLSRSGCYYLCKFLSPYIVIYDKNNIAPTLFSKIYAVFLIHYIFPLLPSGCYDKKLGAQKLLSISYLIIGKIDFCYWLYFAKWYDNEKFNIYWHNKLLQIEEVVGTLNQNENILKGDGFLIFMDKNHIYRDNIHKMVMLEKLSANFWQFFYHLHEHDIIFSEKYFAKHLLNSIHTSDCIKKIHIFLKRKLNIKTTYLEIK